MRGQAPNYSAFMIELVLVSVLFAKEQNLNLSSAASERLARWAEHIRWLMNDDGQVPQIGDCDDCRVIAMTQAPEPRYIASIAAAVAGLLSEPNLAPLRATRTYGITSSNLQRDLWARQKAFERSPAVAYPEPDLRGRPIGTLFLITVPSDIYRRSWPC